MQTPRLGRQAHVAYEAPLYVAAGPMQFIHVWMSVLYSSLRPMV